jgi:protein O-GlcNAc transferase
MTIQAEHIAALVEQINGGRAASALPEVDLLLAQLPENPGLLSLRAEALRLAGHPADAIEAYRRAAQQGAGARSWLAAGVLLAAERATDQAVECLLLALQDNPNDELVLDALVTTFFNGNRHREGVQFARRQLTLAANPTLLTHAALLLHASDLHEESSDAFKRILQLAPNDPTVVGAAIAAARFTCEWDLIEMLQQRLNDWYDRGDFAAPQEFPLTHVTWCPDEARNLGVTRAYVERMVPRADPIPRAPRAAVGRIRVGYVSCDFRNHATMHLMAGLFEHHDQERFEVFAYDYSAPDSSEYRQRFLTSVEHHVEIHTLNDRQAAARIAADQLDILLDLKLYTGGGRSDIMAQRPAPLQAAYLGFPGSAACSDIDYTLADRFVTPDSSVPYYLEKLCRLPHTYQCNDRKRISAPAPGDRTAHGLPQDGIVFGAFNQSYKIDRFSFTVWMRVLQEVPDSVLWLLRQTEAAVTNLSLQARLAGIDPARLIFAPFAMPPEHLARLQLADAILDTLICNGHTTTSDALWAKVPVITARGRHFASRVSESLLNAMELPELVGSNPEDMVRIASRIGTDARYRTALRDKVAAKRLSAPLFDTARFTRNFEAGIQLMVDRHRAGLTPDHIEVPDTGAAPPAARHQIRRMPTLVINLDSQPERFKHFSVINGFLGNIQRFPALPGATLDRARLTTVGLVDPALECTSGTLGCALSHLLVWQRAVTSGVPTTVLEDDAVVNRSFDSQAASVLSELPADWDIICWGWNFDAPLMLDLLPGVSYGLLQGNQDALRQQLPRFQALDIKPRAVRVLGACGTLAYTVSARGASKFIAGCVPIKTIPEVRDPHTHGPYYGIALAMGALFPSMNAYVCFPPLVVSPEHDRSTGEHAHG